MIEDVVMHGRGREFFPVLLDELEKHGKGAEDMIVYLAEAEEHHVDTLAVL